MANSTSVRTQSTPIPLPLPLPLPLPSSRDGDGNEVHNEILLSLPRKEWDSFFGSLEFMRLNAHHILHEAGDSMKSAYFCNSGMFSVLSVMPDGKSVEVGLIGPEGFTGCPLAAGFRTSYTRTVVQADSTAFRVDAETLRVAFRQCPTLLWKVQRYSQMLSMQVTQVATCNRLHDMVQRLARWLLMTQDRIQSPVLPLTQDFLSQMLGSRRSSITVAAGILQRAGAISYRRGEVTVVSRRKLEAAVCDCYVLLENQTEIWREQDA